MNSGRRKRVGNQWTAIRKRKRSQSYRQAHPPPWPTVCSISEMTATTSRDALGRDLADLRPCYFLARPRRERLTNSLGRALPAMFGSLRVRVRVVELQHGNRLCMLAVSVLAIATSTTELATNARETNNPSSQSPPGPHASIRRDREGHKKE